MTLLEDHFDALLLENNNNHWKIVAHHFMPLHSLHHLHKRWQRQSHHIALAIPSKHCHYHSFISHKKLTHREIQRYLSINGAELFKTKTSLLTINFNRLKTTHNNEKIDCVALSTCFLKKTHATISKAGFTVQLIDSQINALLRGVNYIQKIKNTSILVAEKIADNTIICNYSPSSLSLENDTLYCINTKPEYHHSIECINHNPGALTTYGIAINQTAF